MDRPRSREAYHRTLDALQRQLEGARKALAPYHGVSEADLTPWDLGMIRHYEQLKQRLMQQIEELENGGARAG